MNRLFLTRRMPSSAPCWVLAGILLCAAWSRAEDPPRSPHRMENRFLFVIDTSSAMKSRSDGVEQAVLGLLDSGMKGELRKGDTIGLWTYSDRLNTDFPMQVWSEQKKDGIVKQVRDYLRGLRYEKRSHLEKALPTIGQVAADSERLTVILVFDGTDAIKGTPFDKDINDLHKQYAREFRTSREPFVTLLAAHNRTFFDYTINYPGTVVVPHTADPLPPPETNAPPAVAAIPPPPAESALPPAEPKPMPRKSEIISSVSNVATNSPAPPPAANNVIAVVTPAPAPTPVPPAAPTPTPMLIPARTAVTNAPPPVEAAPVIVQLAKTKVAPPESKPEPAPAVTTPPPAPIATIPAKPAQVAPPPRPAPATAAVAAGSTLQQASMFIMAFSLLTIAVVLVLFLVRRSRGGPQPSLISQSIDRSH